MEGECRTNIWGFLEAHLGALSIRGSPSVELALYLLSPASTENRCITGAATTSNNARIFDHLAEVIQFSAALTHTLRGLIGSCRQKTSRYQHMAAQRLAHTKIMSSLRRCFEHASVSGSSTNSAIVIVTTKSRQKQNYIEQFGSGRSHSGDFWDETQGWGVWPRKWDMVLIYVE